MEDETTSPRTPPENQRPAPSLSATQEIQPPTAADVIEVFEHFQKNLLERIDRRDENVLKLIQKTVSEVLEQYSRLARQQDDHARRLTATEEDVHDLKGKYNALASELTAIKLRIDKALT